jgi:hypothetical protein
VSTRGPNEQVLDVVVTAAAQLDIVHALIGRLLFQPFPPESFPAALIRELRYARTLLCSESRWEEKGAGWEAMASYPLPPSPSLLPPPPAIPRAAAAVVKGAQLSLFGTPEGAY